MLEKKLYEEIFLEGEYEEALSFVQENFSEFQDFCLGFLYLEKGDYEKAFEEYGKAMKPYQQGFCALLMGDAKLAREIWYGAKESPSICWGKTLLGIIDGKIEGIPSFLQVRNFAEITLYYLLEAGQLEFFQKLVGAKEFLADCNIEFYKYVGRVLMDKAHYRDLAEDYFRKAIEILPQDYEAYYLLGNLYLIMGEKQKAKSALEKVLQVNKYHTPTEKILQENF